VFRSRLNFDMLSQQLGCVAGVLCWAGVVHGAVGMGVGRAWLSLAPGSHRPVPALGLGSEVGRTKGVARLSCLS
jgi:hypothetical protein